MEKKKRKSNAGRPKIYKDVDHMEALIEDYFRTDAYMGEGDNRVFAPTMSGLALHLGLCRQSLLNYSNDDEFVDAIKKARNKIGATLEQRLYGNNVTGIIFNLKNNFDWKDKKETELSGGLHLTTEEWLGELE
jgi:hypothetical protein